MLAKAENTQAPQADMHGYRTIADIMRALNPFTGEFYREALQVSRWTREMFCLMEGRHVHPSTLYPGGIGTTATIQLMTDYMTRLMRYVEFMKKVVPMHDDLFDFFYEALPGYDQVGLRRTLLGCWGSFQDPELCNFAYKDMERWGDAMFVTPGVVVDGKLHTHSLVDINLGTPDPFGQFVLRRLDRPGDVRQDRSARQPGRSAASVEPAHQPAARRSGTMEDKYSWVMSPRWFDGKDHLALDTGGGPLARLWATALAGLVDIGYVKATGHSVQINLPKTALKGPVVVRVEDPAIRQQHDRARPRPDVLPGLRRGVRAALRREGVGGDPRRPHQDLGEVRGARRGHRLRLHRGGARCAVSHHMVIRDGKIANYHPYPPTPWNASPRDSYGTPGPYEDAVQGQPIFEENDREHFKGIDIMRTVRSFDPCLPCGVHMYLGKGKTLDLLHSPTQSVTGE